MIETDAPHENDCRESYYISRDVKPDADKLSYELTD